ncbi:MAG: threonylcarbamoyl-AMP synthase [Bacteroidales bacterium]|jgi:tRNA threonylcarbamoyl adenosine modification protein (Sua5/YciO/YrdC/YwlC family)|nr:threonylcarbamoyl-AMP synthase [Bacteroidales bacterium]
MIVKIYPENPNIKQIEAVVRLLHDDGVIIYPTDTVYGIGCDIYNRKAIDRIAKIKGRDIEKANFSFICHDLSHLSEYARQVSNTTFKLMKRHLPGPFTFILNASNKVPKLMESRKKTVGIRIPAHSVALSIVEQFGNPILSTSIERNDSMVEYTTDPELIHEKYEGMVDMVIDSGFGRYEYSTVIDCTGDEPKILRQGLGILVE